MGKEDIWSTALVDLEEVLPCSDVLDEVRAVGEAKDVGVYEVHGRSEIELVDLDSGIGGSDGVQEREIAVEHEILGDVMEFGGGLQL